MSDPKKPRDLDSKIPWLDDPANIDRFRKRIAQAYDKALQREKSDECPTSMPEELKTALADDPLEPLAKESDTKPEGAPKKR
jgi:hypothetical protein